MPNQRLPLNLYLLKQGVSPKSVFPAVPADDAQQSSLTQEAAGGMGVWTRTWVLGAEPFEGPLPDVDDGPASLLIRATPSVNAWHALLQNVFPEAPVGDEQPNLGALLFQPIGSDLVVWSFGNAWTLLDPALTVERFGLKAGLNALLTSAAPTVPGKRPKEVGVRGLTSAIRAAVVRKSTVVAARPSRPNMMERVDQASDAASMAELTTHHETFDRVSAGRSLRFEASAESLEELAAHATEAIRLFRRDDYTKNDSYQWIDYTVPVGDRGEVDQVLDELLRQAVLPSPLVIDLVWADADRNTGITPSFACFPREGSKPLDSHRKELTWQTALTWLQGKRAGLPGSESLRTAVRFYTEAGAPPTIEVELWQLLVSQISIGADTYMVSDGDVWRASRSHIADIDNLLAPRVIVNPPWLPPYAAGETEDSYNRRAATYGGHFLLDKHLVYIPGQTPFEPCDLLSHDGLFMHVKRKTSSATMSHVVAQALVSTQLLRSDASARALLDAALLAYSPSLPTLRAMRDHCASFSSRPTATVQVVIVGSWRNNPEVTQLPLLTRISMNGWLRQMPCEAGIVLVGT